SNPAAEPLRREPPPPVPLPRPRPHQRTPRAPPTFPATQVAPEARQTPAPLVSGEPSAAGTSAAAPASHRRSPGRPPDPRRSSRSDGPDSLARAQSWPPTRDPRPGPLPSTPCPLWPRPVSLPARALPPGPACQPASRKLCPPAPPVSLPAPRDARLVPACQSPRPPRARAPARRI
ncbi:hypothetical protein Zm00014a_019082, partial [Zea mays]